MMGFSCMKAVYEYTLLPLQQKKKVLYQIFQHITHKKASNPEKEIP